MAPHILSPRHSTTRTAKLVSIAGVLFLAATCLCLFLGNTASPSLADIENNYADWNDAHDAIQTIDSGFSKTFGGKDRPAWQLAFDQKQKELTASLAQVSSAKLSASDARAIALMRKAVEAAQSAGSTQPAGRCQDAQRTDLTYPALHDALYACFVEIGGNLQFEGQKLDRLTAMEMLGRIAEPQRRKALFLAMNPLWTSINGNDQPDSPYRRLIPMAAAKGAKQGTAITESARTLGVPPAQVEAWLQQILEAWSQVLGDEEVEPWNLDFEDSAADRLLAIPLASMQPINERYYRDLGADLRSMGVLYDLDPHAGKAPYAYAEFATHGRERNGAWHASIPRVSASYTTGSLGLLNEFIHENGHAVHIAAIHTRPAFMDMGDSLFVEAFADVPSWNTYEPAWQQRYLGHAAPESVSLRGLYSGVMMDVAWSLFEVRMLHNPAADPNALWTDITHRYLHVKPHPEWSWWAVRVQLVDEPGYMINYGLGAVLTADLRARMQQQIGSFAAGNPRWYPWISEHLLRFGAEEETSALLLQFLGRPVSPQALLDDMRRAASAKR